MLQIALNKCTFKITVAILWNNINDEHLRVELRLNTLNTLKEKLRAYLVNGNYCSGIARYSMQFTLFYAICVSYILMTE